MRPLAAEPGRQGRSPRYTVSGSSAPFPHPPHDAPGTGVTMTSETGRASPVLVVGGLATPGPCLARQRMPQRASAGSAPRTGWGRPAFGRRRDSGFREGKSGSRVVAQLSLQCGGQAVDHSPDLGGSGQKTFSCLGGQEGQPRGDLDQCLDFHQRAVRDVEEVEITARATPPSTLGDVARDRDHRSAQSARQAVELRLRKCLTDAVALRHQLDPLLPNSQVAEGTDRFGPLRYLNPDSRPLNPAE